MPGSFHGSLLLVLVALTPAAAPLPAPADSLPQLRVTGQLQPRAEVVPAVEGESARSGARFRRARLVFDVRLPDARVSARVTPEFSGGAARLLDGWVDVEAGRGVRIRAGQWQVPFHWQRTVSSARHHLPERSGAAELLGTPGGRDVGVSLRRSAPSGRWVAEGGVFDGGGMERRSEVTPGWLASGRVTRAVVGAIPASEPDLAGTPSPAVALGAGAQVARRNTLGRAAGAPEVDLRAATLDLVGHWQGWSVVLEGYVRRLEPDGDATAVGGPETLRGASATLGAFLLPGRLELVGRTSRAEAWLAPGVRSRRVHDAGANLYLDGHRLKLQAFGRHARPEGGPARRTVVGQLQLLF